MEATTFELWSWRISKTFRIIIIYFVLWPIFLASIPATIYQGVILAGDFFTALRDWWHYKETLPSENSWMGIGIIITGLIWIFGSAVANTPDYKDDTTRFNEFIQRSRSSSEAYQKQREIERAREKTLWGKIKDVFVYTWGAVVLTMGAVLIVKKLFF